MNKLWEILLAIIDYVDNDPVKYCELYKSEGCTHVDVMCCNFPNCTTLIEWENKND